MEHVESGNQDGSGRGVFLRAPADWAPGGTHRVRKLYVPASGSSNAPAASHRALQHCLANTVDSSARMGIRFQVSSAGPRLNFVFRNGAGAVRAVSTHVDDSLGCGEPDVLSKVRIFLGHRLGAMKVQEKPL